MTISRQIYGLFNTFGAIFEIYQLRLGNFFTINRLIFESCNLNNLSKPIYILLLLLTLASCREDFNLGTSSDVPENLSFVSEISPESPVIAELAKTISLLGERSDIDISRTEINFKGTDLPTLFTKVIYRADEENFILRNTDFRVSPGETYEIEAWLPGTDIDTIRAITHVPEPMGLTSVSIGDIRLIESGEDQTDYEFDLSLTLERPTVQPAYFQIIPQRLKSTLRIDQSGIPQITHSNETEELQIVSIDAGRNASSRLTHRSGIFVDYALLSGEEIDLTVRTKNPLITSEEVLQILNIDVHTLSEELYNYHISLHQQLINSSSDFFRPSSNFTNVENGVGVLGSFTTKTVQVDL